jgi:hypothetical protein
MIIHPKIWNVAISKGKLEAITHFMFRISFKCLTMEKNDKFL